MSSNNDQQYTIKRIYIPKQKDIYNNKELLNELGLIWDSKIQCYYNKYDISEETFNELKWLCTKHDFKFEIKIEEYKDFATRIFNVNKLYSMDNSTFAIVDRKTNKNIMVIAIYESVEHDMINLVDCVNGKFASVKIKIQNSNNKLLEVFKILKQKEEILVEDFPEFDINSLVLTLSILLDEFSKVSEFEGKLTKFKYTTISGLEKKGTNVFLCNCVKGFYPETEFFLFNKKIKSTFTNNYISQQQEHKVWKYLYYNRENIGIRKKATLWDLFIGNKIKIIINSFETQLPISKIDWNNGDMIVTVFDGDRYMKLAKTFTKDELWTMILACR